MQMQNILILENRKLRVRVCARVLANHLFSENRKNSDFKHLGFFVDFVKCRF